MGERADVSLDGAVGHAPTPSRRRLFALVAAGAVVVTATWIAFVAFGRNNNVAILPLVPGRTTRRGWPTSTGACPSHWS